MPDRSGHGVKRPASAAKRRLPLLQLVRMRTLTRNKDKNREVAIEMTVDDDPTTRKTRGVAAVGWMHICCNYIFPVASVSEVWILFRMWEEDRKIQRKRGP